jgi:hypothetical protein
MMTLDELIRGIHDLGNYLRPCDSNRCPFKLIIAVTPNPTRIVPAIRLIH